MKGPYLKHLVCAHLSSHVMCVLVVVGTCSKILSKGIVHLGTACHFVLYFWLIKRVGTHSAVDYGPLLGA